MRPPARRTGLWVVWLLGCCAAFIVVYEYFVRSHSGQWLEYAMLSAADARIRPLSEIGLDPWWLQPLAVAIPAVLFLTIVLARQRWVPALIAVGMVIAANLSTQLLKAQWLHRPDLDNGVPYWAGNSLPSGHTTFAASAAVAVFLVCSPRRRPLAALFAACYASAVGMYTFTETWHRPSDVVAAYLVVAVWALAAGWLVMRAAPADNTVFVENEPITAPAAVLAWFTGIVLTVAAGLCFLFAGGWSAVAEAPQNPSAWHLIAGLLLCTGPAFVVSGAGINMFAAEVGRRQRGVELPSPQAERIAYPIPQNFRHLYRV